MTEMKKGERYSCEKCACELEVIKPCTCEQVQDMICTCGTRMRVLSSKSK